MSTTTTSPSESTRSECAWCGFAPLGPLPTMTKSTAEWPSAMMAASRSAATSASVRPARNSEGTRAWTRSMAAAASRSWAISSASLRMNSSRSVSDASTGVARVFHRMGRRWSAVSEDPTPMTAPASPVSGTGGGSGSPSASATSSCGSWPSSHNCTSTSSAGTADAGRSPRSTAGSTSVGMPDRGTTSAVSRSCEDTREPMRYSSSGPVPNTSPHRPCRSARSAAWARRPA